MTTFAKSTFGHGLYASFRPTYPASLYQTVLTYHRARGFSSSSSDSDGDAGSSESLLDLGCGHGLVSCALAPYFSSVTAIDPSPGMVAQARQLTTASSPSSSSSSSSSAAANIAVRQASAEDLSFLPAGSVDLAVAAESAHWFDFTRAWGELARVVRKGGSLAFWGYKESLFVGYPQTIPIQMSYCFSTGEVQPGIEGLGKYWEEPGRTVLQDSFAAIQPPQEEWEEVRRIVFDPDATATHGVEKAPEEALWLRKRLKLGEYVVYMRTISAAQNWRAAHPERKSRAEGGEGDVVDALAEAFVDAVPEWKARGDEWPEIEVEVIWGTCLLMARRRR